MHILHVTEAAGSGTLGVLRSLAAGAAAAGHDVTLAHGRRPETPPDLRERFPPAVSVVPLPWGARTPRAQLAAARALRGVLASARPDVVHLHSSFAGALGALVAGRRPAAVYTPHGYAFARAADRRVAVTAYRAAEWATARRCTVGAVSETEAALAREELRAPRVVVVPNGIPELDPGRLPPPRPRPRPLVVAMGRIAPQRRPVETARILAALADAAEVRWIGGAPAGEAAPLHAAGVPVTGWLPHEEALDQLADATVYVHWSAWDGQSLAILEAFARDVVVIASDIPANRELVGPRQAVATPAEAVALARRVLADPELRSELLGAQRTRRGGYGAARMVADWIAVYAGLA